MRERCRRLDWSATPLGPPEDWPAELRTAVSIVLGSGFPAILVWGPELVQIYNDAYVPLIGAKHPVALGTPTHECWPEISAQQTAIFTRVFRGETVTIADALYTLQRSAQDTADQAFFTASFVPVPLADGTIGGSVSTLFETTADLAARRDALERSRTEASARAALTATAESLATEMRDESRLRTVAEHHVAELDAVIESIPDAVYIGTAAGMSRVNRPALEQLGVSSIDALRAPVASLSADANVRDAATGRPFAPGTSPFARALAGENVLTTIIVRDRSSGEDRILRATANPVIVEGRIVAAVAVNTDITDQQRAEAALRAAVTRAEQASRAKTDFLAVMSHELRTPLNAIGGYAELMAMGIRGPVTDQQREDLERVQRSQRHLLGLINEVLNYAKIETGSVRYLVESVNVREAVISAESLVAPQAAAKRLSIRTGGCPARLAVRADGEKLRQILVNLMSNAVKFTGRGGSITLSCESANGAVRIHLADTGMGIAPDKLDAIFEPFVQVNPGLTRTAEGTGLGLAISRDLARGMGGDLEVRSHLGKGSTFTITLPRDRDSEPADEPSRTSGPD